MDIWGFLLFALLIVAVAVTIHLNGQPGITRTRRYADRNYPMWGGQAGRPGGPRGVVWTEKQRQEFWGREQ